MVCDPEQECAKIPKDQWEQNEDCGLTPISKCPKMCRCFASHCGDPVMSNRRWRARTLHGTCNDFVNPRMGAVDIRMARNVDLPTVDKHFDRFDKINGNDPDKTKRDSDPDVAYVANELMVRKDPYQFNPAPHFNLWAAAWIQFMTHDWFSHNRDGFNDADKMMPLSGGLKATSSLQDAGHAALTRSGPVPKRTFRNKVTHWWDASQLYGWDTQSQSRVRRGAKLVIGSDGYLPVIDLPQYRSQQSAAAFVDNWWLGLSLLHNLFSRHHNWLVDELPKHSDKAPDGKPWTEETLFDTARLINSALIAKIHTTEWTPQLLFNFLGNLVLQANWHGLLNYQPDKNFRQMVSDNRYNSVFQDVLGKLQKNFRCSVSTSLLGRYPE